MSQILLAGFAALCASAAIAEPLIVYHTGAPEKLAPVLSQLPVGAYDFRRITLDRLEPPRARSQPPLVYHGTGLPETAKIGVIIDRRGRVTEICIVDATDRDFATAAAEHIRSWTFHPAQTNGIPVASFVLIPATFRPEIARSTRPARERPPLAARSAEIVAPPSAAPPTTPAAPAATKPPNPAPPVKPDPLPSLPKERWTVDEIREWYAANAGIHRGRGLLYQGTDDYHHYFVAPTSQSTWLVMRLIKEAVQIASPMTYSDFGQTPTGYYFVNPLQQFAQVPAPR